jgi:hypothetical protein
VSSLDSNYFIILRIYWCDHRKDEEQENYTSMGYNPTSNAMLPYGHGGNFPAYFTYRAAIDNIVLNIFRPLVCDGLIMGTFSKMLLEIHSKWYFKCFAEDKNDFSSEKKGNPAFPSEIFSSFNDKQSMMGAF